MKENFITPEGLQKFKEELKEKLEKKKQIGRAIKSAKEQGDLSENAEYSAAKAQQGENERRINWLKCVIEKAQVVEKKGLNQVDLGCLVELEKEENKKENFQVRLVGVSEVSPLQGKISHESPLGKAVMGKKVGDIIEFHTPRGKESYIIKKVD